MISKNIHTFIGCDNDYEESKIVIFGAPFDCTTSYRPGTRFASAAMRSESYGIETYSPYQDRDLEDIKVFDGGDLELPFGNAARALADIEEYAAQFLADKKIPLMIGGEHLVTLGAVRAAA
ncbi:MAG: arginase family protein, partial [Clostridia bacterium]|nr:arginase family protein [Clostridia bacterium]